MSYNYLNIISFQFPFAFLAVSGGLGKVGGAASGGGKANGASAKNNGASNNSNNNTSGQTSEGENNNTDEKDNENGEDGEKAGASSDSGGSLTSPEAVMMFSIAATFDLIGLIPIVGTITNVIAGFFFGFWAFTMPNGKKMIWKFILALVLEAIPVVSDIAPFVSLIGMLFGAKIPASWIGFTYCVITSNDGVAKKFTGVAKGMKMAGSVGGGSVGGTTPKVDDINPLDYLNTPEQEKIRAEAEKNNDGLAKLRETLSPLEDNRSQEQWKREIDQRIKQDKSKH